MTLPPHGRFPLRMPAERIVRAHASVEDAFTARDHLYVARFGKDHPELRGCSLILVGNRTGGERVLDRHGIRSGRSFLYRAYAAWRDGAMEEARRWLAEGRAAGGADASLGRLERLMERTSFRIVFHSDYTRRSLLAPYLDIPGFDVLLTYHAIGPGGPGRLPFNAPLASAVPPGPPIDLVLVDGLHSVPVGVNELGAAVVIAAFDQEWQYDTLPRILPEADWLAVNGTTECVEIGKSFDRECDTYCNSIQNISPGINNLRNAFLQNERPIDLILTGGVTHDFYRDKRQRIMSLYNISHEFNVAIFEGYLPEEEYISTLSASRFTLMTSRYSNCWSLRVCENLSSGIINLINKEFGGNHLFSEQFDCFQSFGEQNPVADIEAHLRDYPNIRARIIAQADRIEDELRDMSPYGRQRATRYFRHLLFVQYVERSGRIAKETPHPRKTVLPLLRDLRQLGARQSPAALAEHLATLIAGARPQGSGSSADWLRLALLQTSTTPPQTHDAVASLENGLRHHPRSLPLHYARALCHLRAGESALAEERFAIVCEAELEIAKTDPSPRELEPVPAELELRHQTFWTMDARIRQHSPDVLEPLVPEISVWRSLAFAHRATLALEAGHTARAGELAQAGLACFERNDVAQRILLRTRYASFLAGDRAAADAFLADYAIFRWMDGLVFHDLAPLAVHIMAESGRHDEAEKLVAEVSLALERILLPARCYALYPEAEPLLERYALPHGALRSPDALSLKPFLARRRAQ
jgi:hypothetical protein